jgi:hypothetical protein
MFAFPAMFPAQTLRAVGLPLLGIIAISLCWVTGAPTSVAGMPWVLVIANGVLFSWLAVRCHRVVLLGAHEDAPAHRLKTVASYLAAVVVGTLVRSIFMAIVSSRYVPAGGDPASGDGMIGLPVWATWIAQALPFYLLARFSLALPGFALGQGWRLGEAWRLSRGNGWRLVLIVFLLPVGIDWFIALVYGYVYYSVAVAALAIFNALLTAESVIALSLAYRELVPPAPPPTAPPA